MYHIPVFAGLGSDTLFSPNTSELAIRDASVPESQIILQACHAIFCTQISRATGRGHISASSINLDDFPQPETLLRPDSRYHQNVVIQHATIYLVQIIRYIGHGHKELDIRGAAGFCTGLLPAAAISTTTSTIELLQRAQDLFLVALWIGISADLYRRNEITHSGCAADLPWGIVVEKLSQETISSLTKAGSALHNDSPVYVSAKNSPSCVTLSGRGDQLAMFVGNDLPSECKTRPTNVLTLYHHREKLNSVFQQTLSDIEREMSSRLDALITSSAPLFSTATGAPIVFPATGNTLRDMITLLLEMVLLEPVDWVQVQDAVLDHIQQSDPAPCGILNFGPGYGISRFSKPIPEFVEIRDVSAVGASRLVTNGCPQVSLDDIAIVGLAIELPDAQDTVELWKNLLSGIPQSRFYVDDFYLKEDADGSKAKRSMKTRYGNFLRNPFLFDNELFDISPREAKSIDPQQRVLLQTAYRALENAGYVPDSTPSFSRDTFGCFVGSATLDYVNNLSSNIDVYYSPGTLRAFQSGRISYYFGWSGPSITLDTACSSSMVAIHQAARAIAVGDCRAALVGGVNVITSPDMYLGLDRAHFLSPTGQCKAFDASADGYSRSEGCGMIVIKTMRDALAEGDHIHGIIKGIEVNQSGNAHSITHPHAPTQEQLFQKLFTKTMINPHQITVVETHGTGTQAGDPNEVASLRRVVCDNRHPQNLAHFTSIKANIGHCEAASGVAALAKIALMMKHGAIPPQISLSTLNPKIQELGTDGAVIDRVITQWVQPNKGPKLALINNFGAAGSNAAMILQEYIPHSAKRKRTTYPQTYVFGLSAKNAKSLERLRQDLIAMLAKAAPGSNSLGDICYSSTARRQLYDYRISVTADTILELTQKLEKAEIHHRQMSKSSEPPVVFVFSGQGTQYLGMGRQLLSIYPVFSDTIHRCDRILRLNGFPGCLDIIQSDETMSDEPKDLAQLQAFQSAIFALEVSLSQLLISWNIFPQAVVGHSLGEYAALVTAGVLDLDSGTLLVARRAQLMMSHCEIGSTSMLAVNVSASDAQAIVDSDERFASLSISCDNSPRDCVIGGPIPSLEGFKEYLTEHGGIKSKLLDVPMAYHTEAMDPMLDDLTRYANTLTLKKPTITVISNTFGRAVLAGESVFTADYFVRHSRQTVAFHQGLEDFLRISPDSTAAYWVEVGPHASLLPMIASQAPQAESRLLPCLRKGVSSSTTLSQLLSYFYLKSSSIDWRQAFAFSDAPGLTDLPVLPFHQSEFVVAYPHEPLLGPRLDSQGIVSTNIFLGRTIQVPSNSNQLSGIYETSIQSLQELILGHIVCDYALCPASVYHQMALSAIEQAEPNLNDSSVWSIANVSYVAPLLYTTQSSRQIRIHVSPNEQRGYTFAISSYIDGTDPDTEGVSHCNGHLKRKEKQQTIDKALRTERALERHLRHFIQPESRVIMETFTTKVMYNHVFTRVVTYSEVYQQVQSICISPDYDEAYARCKFDGMRTREETNSIFMDVLLHVAGFVANLSVGSDEVGICKEVSSALVIREPSVRKASFDVYCTLVALPDQSIIVADAKAVDGNGIMAIYKGMAFQRVKLSGISRAFSAQSKKTQGFSPSIPTKNPISVVQKLTSPSFSRATLSNSQSTPTPDSRNSIRKTIAEACGLSLTALPTGNLTLKELGFDSLLQIELEAQLVSKFPQLDIGGLTDCETIKDIENLLSLGKQTSDTPPSLASGTATSEANSDDDVPDIQQLIRAVIAETCSGDINSITSSSELSALGIDSLMVFEIKSSLAKIDERITVSTAELAECLTVGDIEKLVSSIGRPRQRAKNCSATSLGSVVDIPSSFDSTGPTAVPTPVPFHSFSLSLDNFLDPDTITKITQILRLQQQPEVIQTLPSPINSSQSAPLFLVHDGSGICTHYRRLGSLGRPVYALHDPKFLDLFASWATISDMVEDYCRVIMSTTEGPYLLGGWSFGGVVAFEVARRLKQLGHAVIGIILIDSPPPINHRPLSSRLIHAVVQEGKLPSTDSGKAIQAFIRSSFTSCASLLGRFCPRTVDEMPVPNVYLLRSREGWKYPTDPHIITDVWVQDRSDPQAAVKGWEEVSQSKVQWEDIPGDHFRVFDRVNVDAVTDAIRRASSKLEASFFHASSTRCTAN
ncbi:putative polyketide synthase [Xylaria telfairii]|nr:putative polyketide synthase [Xylaria telfairii]